MMLWHERSAHPNAAGSPHWVRLRACELTRLGRRVAPTDDAPTTPLIRGGQTGPDVVGIGRRVDRKMQSRQRVQVRTRRAAYGTMVVNR